MEIPQLHIFDMIGVAKATAEKKVAAGELISGSGGQAAIGMAKLLAKAKDAVANSTAAEARDFDSAKWLGKWLEIPQPALGGRKPAELLDTPTGLDVVLKLLGAIERRRVSMILWRIAAETRQYKADDVTGRGAAKSPGRWNEAGQALLYTAPTIAIAVLETAAHIDDSGLPLNRYLVRLEMSPAVWPPGSSLCAARFLMVPSVIVPEESATLINPAHPDAAKVKVEVVRPFEYNKLLRGS